MAKLAQKTLDWVARMKKRGSEVRLTKNGQPYAVLRGTRRVPEVAKGKEKQYGLGL